jgi:hypothetical protein
LERQQNGTWSCTVQLSPGTYEYRFIVDGQWVDDPLSPRYVHNPFGGTNCVLEVKGFE